MSKIHLTRTWPRACVIVATLLLAVFIVVIPLAIGAGEGFLGTALLAVAAPSSLVIYLLVRGVQIGATADDAGVVIRNFWRTRRFAWSDVGELVTGPAPTAWQTGAGLVCLIVRARTGRSVFATGTITRHVNSEQFASELAQVFALADRHGVRWEWRDLTPEQLAEIQRKVEAIQQVTGLARRLR